MDKVAELAEELNIVAEYAGSKYTFVVKKGPSPNTALVFEGDESFLVNIKTCLRLVKGLPDRATNQQVTRALLVSHPGVELLPLVHIPAQQSQDLV